MSIPPNVACLDSYRIRREQRLQRSLALYRADPDRCRVSGHLAAAVDLIDGERAAAVWVDEHGPGLVHVHCMIDLGSDEPRRSFPIESLKAAWDCGVPGFLDSPATDRLVPTRSGLRSVVAVALGSDGSRAWFVIVDSAAPRQPIDALRRHRLMFLAGECAGVLLHQDVARPGTRTKVNRRHAVERNESFAGWSVLKDVEERASDDSTSRRVSARFLVARLVTGLVDEAFEVDASALGRQLEAIRREIGPLSPEDAEHRSWTGVLDAVQRGARHDLLGQMLTWGTSVEHHGHFNGAQEIYRTAFDVGVAIGSVQQATDAARFHARTARKLSEYQVCEDWYNRALSLAETVSDLERVAHVYSGLANTYRELGNLPKARQTIHLGIESADRSGSVEVQAVCRHNLMAVEKAQGNLNDAVVLGWEAFETYPSDDDKLIVLSDLAEVLAKQGSFGSAEDAYSIVIHRTRNAALRALALAGRASVAALRGNMVLFVEWIRRADSEGWQELAPSFSAQIALDRGIAYRTLGQIDEARHWLERARVDSEEHRLNQLAFRASAELKTLDKVRDEPAPQGDAEDAYDPDPRVADILQSLSTMRAGF